STYSQRFAGCRLRRVAQPPPRDFRGNQFNLQSVLLPPGVDPQPYVPFPDFARGSAFADTIGTANYHSLQTKYERRFANGLAALVSYTFYPRPELTREML